MHLEMRVAALLLALACLGAGLWQARPVLVWHLTAAPEIERMGRSERVHVPTELELPDPDPAWARVRVGRLDLRAPLRAGEEESCRSCSGDCRLALEPQGGWLVLFEGDLASHEWAVVTFAPSAEDVSLWRGRLANWSTVHALAARATGSTPPLEAFRFDTPTSRGIVSRVVGRDHERFVVYAFAPDGGPGGALAVSRTSLPLLRRMLGGLRVGDTVGPPRCDAGGRP
jgi:hypothetical protein